VGWVDGVGLGKMEKWKNGKMEKGKIGRDGLIGMIGWDRVKWEEWVGLGGKGRKSTLRQSELFYLRIVAVLKG